MNECGRTIENAHLLNTRSQTVTPVASPAVGHRDAGTSTYFDFRVIVHFRFAQILTLTRAVSYIKYSVF